MGVCNCYSNQNLKIDQLNQQIVNLQKQVDELKKNQQTTNTTTINLESSLQIQNNPASKSSKGMKSEEISISFQSPDPLTMKYSQKADEMVQNIENELLQAKWQLFQDQSQVVCEKSIYQNDWLSFKVQTVFQGYQIQEIEQYFDNPDFIKQ